MINSRQADAAPVKHGQELPRPLPKRPWLHFGMCLSVAALWITTFILMTTPNSKLHAMGLGNAIAFDLTLGVLYAFCVALVSLSQRRSCPSTGLFLMTQFLAWGHSVGLVILLALAASFAVRAGA